MATKTTAAKKSRSSSNGKLTSFNPATGEVLGEIVSTPPAEVREIVAQARKMAAEWGSIPIEGRLNILKEVRYRLYDLMDDIVEVVSAECGKPKAEALGHDVLPPIIMLQNFEKTAAKTLAPQKVGTFSPPRLLKTLVGASSRIEWRPFGVVGVITPWNYPITNSFLAFLPALVAGNAVVIKPSEVTPRCGEMLREILDPLPAGVASVIQGSGEVGAALVDAQVDKISFIGSPATGRKICEAAAKHLTPVVMELGGNDAAVVCEDADVDYASSGVLWGAFFNAGQTCCSIERAYVVDSIADDFEDKLVSKLNEVRKGPDGDVGSLTFKPQLDTVQRHVDDAVKKGAKVLAGGPDATPKSKDGSLWYAPTILSDVNDEMEVLTHETFGPVLTVVRVRDEEEAVRRANEESVNLTASIWTKDRKRAQDLSQRLRAGTITINFHGETPAAPWSPWGGVGESGYGRLNGELGLKEFSVPVHVSRPMSPMKRVFWYPYDEATVSAVRSIAKGLSTRSRSESIREIVSALGQVTKAVKNKL